MIITLIKIDKMQNRLSIIEALERARKAQGLTQDELASIAGANRMTVSRVEAGFDPKLSTVYELARSLGLELTLVPKELASQVQGFIRSGGRVLGQPSGADAPMSVVELASVAKTVRSGDRQGAMRPTPQPSARNSSTVLASGNVPRAGQLYRITNTTGKPSISPSAAARMGRLSPTGQLDKPKKQ